MEQFRPLIADSTVITVINSGVITAEDFLFSGNACNLNAKGKRKLVEAYERRMNQLVTHPTFGYKISYRRILEVQCRLLGRYFSGEIDQFPNFITR